MKLQRNAETFNLGDTSFRRKTLIDDYKTLLPFLRQINEQYEEWNNQAQADFYKNVLENTDLFDRNDREDFAKRGRTLTSPLQKIGLTNENRKLSEIANHWIDANLQPADNVERILGLDLNNLLFLRQLLKLRVYDSNAVDYFYPFRVALQLLIKYQNIPQQDFLTLIHLIKPTFGEDKIKQIIANYQKVADNQELFSEFLANDLSERASESPAKALFSTETLDREQFDNMFVNRKSSDTQDTYYAFVVTLIKFKQHQSEEDLKKLLQLSSDGKIKKAFGFGKKLFNEADNVGEFYEKNKDNILLTGDNPPIYNQFVLSKTDDIVKEYRDMTKRTFNLTGLINFNNGLVNIINQEVMTIIFDKLQLAGQEEYDHYEQNLTFRFYQDLTISEILGLDQKDILIKLKDLLGVEETTQIEDKLNEQKETKFRDFIAREFPKEEILEILPMFSIRKDDEIKEKVSETATVPTIFEYMVAISWFYISNKDFFITNSINLTLDGDMRPLSHAAGGAGDIVIDYQDMTLMLEVTLMNKQAQKRGEWEPVLRHSANLTIEKSPKNVTTLFIADTLDENTINIWRAVASVPLKSSNQDAYAEQVRIFPLTNKELIRMLEKGINEQQLLDKIENFYAPMYNDNFDKNWREKILSEILND
ncbi:AlwI family type II restriction endonuclease [Tetragenococcus halophilus]|uniref:AlwI family type II restriction endonuclease n=1 Tax=Tetragenococcus halophilus TaxID=51669 RepID=A0A3G5FH82_TETHA|nr:AlwI family type II restriction endonuclease [Tetragenococcus halophilus]AYW49696.1 AlwI family type II restriction endonuclease [Tetragenococcus halophilus]MCF1602622.1 AlwI family type II restriction endonuclease [Tetragenococcus halophilus]GBD64007.1 hypothetical protein TEHD23766T_1434 [Tetragenococcus halophilus subsp. flandriensis]GBD73902.1 hypothetical protein TEHN7125_2062 [Tetragenococcus halophilus subsp. halophilus]GBD76702.1 hypothetical protein TEHN7126_2401 [Tetragenococcus h